VPKASLLLRHPDGGNRLLLPPTDEQGRTGSPMLEADAFAVFVRAAVGAARGAAAVRRGRPAHGGRRQTLTLRPREVTDAALGAAPSAAARTRSATTSAAPAARSSG